VTAPVNLISRDAAVVKAELLNSFGQLVEPLIEAAQNGTISPREIEQRVWVALVQVGRVLLTVLFAAVCRRETARAVHALGLQMFDVALRMDEDYVSQAEDDARAGDISVVRIP